MNSEIKSYVVLGLTVLCGALSIGVIVISPNPMPASYGQALAAFLAMFSAGGIALIRDLSVRPARKRQRVGSGGRQIKKTAHEAQDETA
jgi:hypothetical protein